MFVSFLIFSRLIFFDFLYLLFISFFGVLRFTSSPYSIPQAYFFMFVSSLISLDFLCLFSISFLLRVLTFTSSLRSLSPLRFYLHSWNSYVFFYSFMFLPLTSYVYSSFLLFSLYLRAKSISFEFLYLFFFSWSSQVYFFLLFYSLLLFLMFISSLLSFFIFSFRTPPLFFFVFYAKAHYCVRSYSSKGHDFVSFSGSLHYHKPKKPSLPKGEMKFTAGTA